MIKPRSFVGVLLAIGIATACSSAIAQGIGSRNRPSSGGSATISGKVVMPDGTPAIGARVAIASSDVNLTTYSDHDGNYSFGGVPGGNYTVTATVEGLPPASESYSIDQDSAAGQTITLPLYIRNVGQKKGDFTTGPMFANVPAGALSSFSKGMEKMQVNDAKGAISLFDLAIAGYPNFAAAYYERGSAYLKEKDLDKALESFVKAIAIKSDYLEPKYSVGYVQYLKNNFEVAAAVFDDVLKQKQMPEAHLYLGISLVKIHDIDASVPHFKAALAARDDESMALAHRYLGGIYMQKKQNAEAASELEKYLKLVPKAPDADKLKATIADLRKQS